MIKVKIKAEPVDIMIIHRQVYMPTTNHEEEEVENTYERLEEVLDRTKGTDYVVIMGDWNAVVGEGADGKNIGKYGLGKRNNRGEKLTELCNRREQIPGSNMRRDGGIHGRLQEMWQDSSWITFW